MSRSIFNKSIFSTESDSINIEGMYQVFKRRFELENYISTMSGEQFGLKESIKLKDCIEELKELLNNN